MERISIEGFGGFTRAEFETAPIMVLIGEQATGKSIVAKLLYFFRNLGANPPVLSYDSEAVGIMWCQQEFSTLFPPKDWGIGGFEILYECRGESVRISRPAQASGNPQNELEIKWSGYYSGSYARWSQSVGEVNSSLAGGDAVGFANRLLRLREGVRKDVEEALGKESSFEQVFVPAERGFFAQVSGNIFAMLAATEGDLSKSFGPFLYRFGRHLENYKNNFKSLGFFDPRVTGHGRFPSVREYVEGILKAEYTRENDQEILLHPDGRQVGLASASSGQQESLPLLLTLGRVLAGGHDPGRNVYFEEPEAHLFPTSQRKIVELTAAAFNLRRDRVRFLLTTHSPYILTAVNNLLQAGDRYSKTDGEAQAELERVVPSVLALKPGVVAAYSLADGHGTNIIDPETNLIDAGIIDKVSTEIDLEFERLLWGA